MLAESNRSEIFKKIQNTVEINYYDHDDMGLSGMDLGIFPNTIRCRTYSKNIRT